MEPKEIDIEFTRGDTCPIQFELLDEEKNVVDIDQDAEIYFTVKQSYSSTNAIFQKKYSNNEIEQENGICSLIILPEDTRNLNYGSYVYDICIKSGNYVHTLAIGQLSLTNEATHARNE